MMTHNSFKQYPSKRQHVSNPIKITLYCYHQILQNYKTFSPQNKKKKKMKYKNTGKKTQKITFIKRI